MSDDNTDEQTPEPEESPADTPPKQEKAVRPIFFRRRCCG
jgi:hypothetical protein